MDNQVSPTECSSELPAWSDPKILVVEDDPVVCESIRVLLGYHGFAVRTSENLLAAQEALLDNAYDLVLLDLKLKDQCGFAVMDHLLKHNLDTQVIVVTGHHSENCAITALKKGATDYLKKPFNPDDLLASVNNVLSRQKCQREMSLLTAAIAASSAAISIADADGRIVYTNAAYRRMMDPPDSGAANSPPIPGAPADRKTFVDEQVRNALDAGTPWEGKIEAVDSAGRRFEAWKWVDPIPEPIGGVAFGAALVHDIAAPMAEKHLQPGSKLRKHSSATSKLGGTLPICASCKRVRDGDGTWNDIEAYIESNFECCFSHSLCPQCARRLYPELYP